MVLRGLCALAIVTCFSTAAFAVSAKKAQPTLRDQEQAACYNDAMTLCKDAVPDEKKIETCMRANMSQVSPGCRAYFK